MSIVSEQDENNTKNVNDCTKKYELDIPKKKHEFIAKSLSIAFNNAPKKTDFPRLTFLKKKKNLSNKYLESPQSEIKYLSIREAELTKRCSILFADLKRRLTELNDLHRELMLLANKQIPYDEGFGVNKQIPYDEGFGAECDFIDLEEDVSINKIQIGKQEESDEGVFSFSSNLSNDDQTAQKRSTNQDAANEVFEYLNR